MIKIFKFNSYGWFSKWADSRFCGAPKAAPQKFASPFQNSFFYLVFVLFYLLSFKTGWAQDLMKTYIIDPPEESKKSDQKSSVQPV